MARIRALCAALFLLIAAVAAPVAIATQAADQCSMTCCVREGYCCCSPHHAKVKGQVSDDKPHLSESELSASCPQGCATAVRSSNLHLRANLRADDLHALADEPPVMFLDQVLTIRDLIDCRASAPRAPPVSSIL